MKKLRIIIGILAGILILSCEKETINELPDAPILLKPVNGEVTGIDTITFKWECTDPERDEIKYTFFISSDSISWESQFIGANAYVSNPIHLEKGKKLYWKVKAENEFSGNPPQQEKGEAISDVNYFYTTPPGVTNLRDTSGHEFITLFWEDPENLDHVEITFEPTISGITQPITVDAGVEKIELTGLENGTIYSFFVKTYNNLNHVSEADIMKAMPLLPTQVHDVDFNIYNTIIIGTQTWLRENLRVTRFQDGSPFVNGYGEQIPISSLTGSESDKYGLYYYSILASGGYDFDKNVCPCGYHVPTDDEWKTLESYLGMTEIELNSAYVFRGEDEKIGESLKSTSGWNDYNGENGNGSDIYGLSILPSGFINYNGEQETGETSLIWTSTGSGHINVYRMFSNSSDGINRSQNDGKGSIRCIKD